MPNNPDELIITSIKDDVMFLMKTVAEHFPEGNDIKPLIQGQLMTIHKLLSIESGVKSGIPSLRSRKQSLVQVPVDGEEERPRRSLANEWAANLPERPGVHVPFPKKKARTITADKNGLPIESRSFDDVEVHEVPGSAKCPACGERFISSEGNMTHPEDHNYDEHPTTGHRPVRACDGNVYYLMV